MKKKLVAESLRELLEGVSDKYAARKWGIPDEEAEFEKKYQQLKSGKKVGKVKGYDLIKNPNSLSSFPNNSRGIIVKDGDLYVVPNAMDIIHIDVLDVLKSMGIIKSDTRGWENVMDNEDNTDSDFVCVQRVWNRSIFAISESYMLPKTKNENSDQLQRIVNFFTQFFDASKKKNPNFKYVLKQIRLAARSILSSEEYEKFRKN